MKNAPLGSYYLGYFIYFPHIFSVPFTTFLCSAVIVFAIQSNYLFYIQLLFCLCPSRFLSSLYISYSFDLVLWLLCYFKSIKSFANTLYFTSPVSRLVQPSVHQLHSAPSHLLLPAADLLPCHSDGHVVLGVLLDRPQGRPCQSAIG